MWQWLFGGYELLPGDSQRSDVRRTINDIITKCMKDIFLEWNGRLYTTEVPCSHVHHILIITTNDVNRRAKLGCIDLISDILDDETKDIVRTTIYLLETKLSGYEGTNYKVPKLLRESISILKSFLA